MPQESTVLDAAAFVATIFKLRFKSYIFCAVTVKFFRFCQWSYHRLKARRCAKRQNYCKQSNHWNSCTVTATSRAILSEKSFESAATIRLRTDVGWVFGWRRASAGARPATAETWSRLRGASYGATKASADAAMTTSAASAAHLRSIFAVLYTQGAS